MCMQLLVADSWVLVFGQIRLNSRLIAYSHIKCRIRIRLEDLLRGLSYF